MIACSTPCGKECQNDAHARRPAIFALLEVIDIVAGQLCIPELAAAAHAREPRMRLWQERIRYGIGVHSPTKRRVEDQAVASDAHTRFRGSVGIPAVHGGFDLGIPQAFPAQERSNLRFIFELIIAAM